MKKVVCCPTSLLPTRLDRQVEYLSLYSHAPAGRPSVGSIAPTLPTLIQRAGLMPPVQTWDFTTIALSVAAADQVVLRKDSPDGWTRMIELSICLNEPAVWEAQRELLESCLQHLTGDFWTLRFLDGGLEPLRAKQGRLNDADCVCLLSGGADSLVGGIDLITAGRKPLFVSRIVRGDAETQRSYARELGAQDRHYQWSFTVNHTGESEPSTRGRSIVFFAFAALAASAIQPEENQRVEIIVPENGFVSLNISLTPGRSGSLSTKTTHPLYMNGIQSLWNACGINAQLSFPYRYKTKGEVFAECSDQAILKALVNESKSCGKIQRHNLTHCGECFPCLVRRAAFLAAGIPDRTKKGYLSKKLRDSTSRDLLAVASAFLRYKQKGLPYFVGGALAFASNQERVLYERVVARGMDELGQLLKKHGVL